MKEDIVRVLKDLLDTYGTELCSNRLKLKGLLMDYCNDSKREINLLISAVEEKIPAELKNYIQSELNNTTYKKYIKKLYDNLGISEEFAKWTVDAWITALNISVETKQSLATKTTLADNSKTYDKIFEKKEVSVSRNIDSIKAFNSDKSNSNYKVTKTRKYKIIMGVIGIGLAVGIMILKYNNTDQASHVQGQLTSEAAVVNTEKIEKLETNSVENKNNDTQNGEVKNDEVNNQVNVENLEEKQNAETTQEQQRVQNISDQEILQLLANAFNADNSVLHGYEKPEVKIDNYYKLKEEFNSYDKLDNYLRQFWDKEHTSAFVNRYGIKYINGIYCVPIGDGTLPDYANGRVLSIVDNGKLKEITVSAKRFGQYKEHRFVISYQDNKWVLMHTDDEF